MTVRIEPTQGPSRAVSSTRLLAPFKYAGHGDWIFPGGQTLINGESVPSVRDPDLVGPLDAFDATYATDSLTVTIATGEAVVEGAYIGSDDATITDSNGNAVHDVTLDASTNGQAVYLGYDHTAADVEALIIGRDAAFTSSDQPRLHLWSFDTDSTGVTNATSHRPIGERIDVENRRYEGAGSQAVDRALDADALAGVAAGNYLRSDVAETITETLTIDTGDTTVALDLATGDVVGVEDIEFGGGANPQIKLPEDVDIWDQENGVGLATWATGVGLNLHQNELVNVVIDNKGARPGDAVPGTLIYRTDRD